MGIILIALGSKFYGALAYNLYLSIRKYSNIPITILADDSINGVPKMDVNIIKPKFSDYLENKVFNPFKLKTYVYDYSPYEKTIYLDVDSILIKDINELIKEVENMDFQIHEVSRYSKDTWHKCNMVWLKDVKLTINDLYKAYGLKNEVYAEYNTSFMYFTKSDKNKLYFEQAKRNYIDRKTNYRKIGGHYPDEMAFNLASSQLKHYGNKDRYRPIYFNWEGGVMTLSEMKEQFYFLGMAGGRPSSKQVTMYESLARGLGSKSFKFNPREKIFHQR